MRLEPSLLWKFNRTIDRVPYLATGIALFLVKFLIDWTIAGRVFGRSWSPLNYLIWPNDRTLRIFELGPADRWFSLTMLLVSLPFIWMGVTLTLHRLRSAGLPLGLILFFFVPVVNLLFYLTLVILPADAISANLMPQFTPASPGEARSPKNPPGTDMRIMSGSPAPAEAKSSETSITRRPRAPAARRFETLREAHYNIALESPWRSGLLALSFTVPLVVFVLYIGANVLQSYGFGMFVGAPVAAGMISVLAFGFSRSQRLGPCLAVALATSLLAGFALLGFAIEGVICLLMAAPITVPLVLLGGFIGYIIQSRPALNDETPWLTLALIIFIPSMMGAESIREPELGEQAVRTEVIIVAPPDQVWSRVIAFAPLPEPDDWFFHTGVAYPRRADIYGSGAGAVRHCVFSTGTFVEPIDVWDAPRRLAFRVTEQPDPLREWSPYDIHPAHLDHYFVSNHGEFLLEDVGDGRTRLVGTTWYTNRMWPASYWNRWCDYIIHRIHLRVLEHIRGLAEKQSA